MPAALQGVYVAQAQRPDRSGPALEAARDRLRIAWEHLVHADASEEIALLKTRTSGATRTAAAANPIE